MKLSALGSDFCEEWSRSAEIRANIRLFEDVFCVMPNHAHGIVSIVDTTVAADGVRTDDGRADAIRPNKMRPKIQSQDARRASLQRAPRSVGSFIAAFKASVTSRAGREFNMTGIWQ